jgi:NAD-dependent SIR2 family protein deacetylase
MDDEFAAQEVTITRTCSECGYPFDLPAWQDEEDARNGDPPICASCQGDPGP